MREALFIKKNRDKWTAYRNEPVSDPDEQADRFIVILDDLAYAKTHYPQSRVTGLINGIAIGFYQNIYRHKKEKYKRVITFWTHELPLVIYRHYKTLLFTFLFFSACVAIGWLSNQYEPAFVNAVLGEGYVSMTEHNISNGDPFGVYRDDNKFLMFVEIAFNNIRVSFLVFVGGLVFWMIFWNLSCLRVLMFNGIMIGCFEHLFFTHGLGLESILTVWLHGTLEIWSIILAGTAGMIMGLSYVVPGALPRRQSFMQGVRDASKIILALIPFFIGASFIESYVTYLSSNRFSTQGGGLPVWLSSAIIIASLLFIGFYFFYLPVLRHRQQKKIYSSCPSQVIHQP